MREVGPRCVVHLSPLANGGAPHEKGSPLHHRTQLAETRVVSQNDTHLGQSRDHLDRDGPGLCVAGGLHGAQFLLQISDLIA